MDDLESGPEQEELDHRRLSFEFVEVPEPPTQIEDAETVRFWESKQRELVTSVVDYNLESLGGLVKSRLSICLLSIRDDTAGMMGVVRR